MTDLLDGTKCRSAGHYDGKEWFGDMMRVIEHPRIAYMVKVPRSRRGNTFKQEIGWYLDGENLGTREACLAAYAERPLPTLTDEQRNALALVGDEFGPFPDLPSRIPLMELAQKGCVEHADPPPGERRHPIRRTALGRKVLGL